MRNHSQNLQDPELMTVYQAILHIYIFGNLKCSRKADHILEMERLGLLCYYRFVNYICNM